MNAPSSSGLTPASRALAQAIMDATSLVVRTALKGDWEGAAAIADHRRYLLDCLLARCQPADTACVEALRLAVVESDQVLAGIRTVSGARQTRDAAFAVSLG